MKRLLRLARKVRSRLLYKSFQPKECMLKHVSYRGASFVVPLNEDIGWRLVNIREYEEDEICCLEGIVRDDDLCVDVGGNIGIYSVFMARKASAGKVVAFEPIPINRKMLALNLALNNLDNVEIMDCVLSDTTGDVSFSVSKDSAYSSMRPTNRKEESCSLQVRSRTFDELFASKGIKVGIVKVDVEGAELLVLRGAARLLSDPAIRPRAVLVELSVENQSAYGYHPGDVVRYMRTVGYDAYCIKGPGLLKGWPHRGCGEDVLFMPHAK